MHSINKGLFGTLLIIFVNLNLTVLAQSSKFNKWFNHQTLRINLIHSGSSKTEHYSVHSYRRIALWSGSTNYLLDTSGYGDIHFEVLDSASQTPIYLRGFDNMFYEWQQTEQAQTEQRSFEEVIRFPFPKKSVQIMIYRRISLKKKVLLHSFFLNPRSVEIELASQSTYANVAFGQLSSESKAVDVVVLPDGYTQSEMPKFIKDSERMISFLLSTPPFDSLREYFNFRMVLAPSVESGTDIPGKGIWKNTLLDSHFNSLGSDRYLTTQSIFKMHDMAQAVPYDQVYVLVNSPTYGGGGIYNYYNLSSVDDSLSPWVFIHEFGHGFAGLADEYEDDEISYSTLYSSAEEPWRPNITNLADSTAKWQNMADSTLGVPSEEIDENRQKIGFYEGGGYVSKGIYRPYISCEMRSLQSGFCPVCQKAIRQMIVWSTQ